MHLQLVLLEDGLAGGVAAGKEEDLQHLPGHQVHPAAHLRAAGGAVGVGQAREALLAHKVALRVGAII